jgi:hypothetical protein
MSVVEHTRPLGVRNLVVELARALDDPEAPVLGRAVAVALRWQHSGPRVFLSGLPSDVITRVCDAFGAALEATPGAGPSTLAVVDEWWSTPAGHGVGTGPVVLPPDGQGPDATRYLHITPGTAPPPPKLEQAQALRTQLRNTAVELDRGLSRPPDPGALLGALDSEPDVAAAIVDNVAEGRLMVGRHLLDVADTLDDERIDQLGDGYVRAAHLWRALPQRREPDLLREVLALERSCADWMYGASSPPTRYTF